MISIDQNCSSLWDAIPKLGALAAKGYRVAHYVEDIDVAFTSMGSGVGEGGTGVPPVSSSVGSGREEREGTHGRDAHATADGLKIDRERFHRSGGQDWGAAMFYSAFLGRLPVEIRDWEPYTGMKTHVLAGQLGRSVDELYEQYSPADNWQLIGPSYVGDKAHHRVMGDLSCEQTQTFLADMLALARKDMLRTFPQADCGRRINDWFDREQAAVDAIMARGPCTLAELYRQWLGHHLGEAIPVGMTSQLFGVQAAQRGDCPCELLELFLRDYDTMSGLYNEAIERSRLGLRPLRTGEGELPFFGTMQYQGHLVRCAAFVRGDTLTIGQVEMPLGPQRSMPLDAMHKHGIYALAGKAILLVLQVRTGAHATGLALPYHGSMYMPAAYCFERLLDQHKLLSAPPQPVFRVRLHLLDRIKSLDVTISLPEHLRGYFGKSEILARELSENYLAIARQAAGRLARFRSEEGRQSWYREGYADIVTEIDQMDRRRRELAQLDPKAPELRQIWKDLKLRKQELLAGLVHQISCDWQASNIDYWDSRGAIMPWCVAMGGQQFYNDVLAGAEIYAESSHADIVEQVAPAEWPRAETT